MTIIPSYPAPSFNALATILDTLQGTAQLFQVDIVSEAFAGVASWPETEPTPLRSLRELEGWTTTYRFEIDLMVERPVAYFAPIVALGITDVVVHVTPSTHIASVLSEARECHLEPALAVTADVPLELVIPFIQSKQVRAVQLMGIAKVGKQGQPFDERVLSRVRELRTLYPDLLITIDGAVNETTLPLLYAAGASRGAPGSAIVASEDPVAAYKHLSGLVGT